MNKGVITTYVLVFGAIFLIMLAGLLGFILLQLRQANQKVAWNEAFEIAEAGINYYRWCLNNEVTQNCQTEKEYQDSAGNSIGKFSLQIETSQNCGILGSAKIISTGWTFKFPNIKRKISVFYARESVARYSCILNSNVWVGADHVIRGPYHSNGGIRFDGKNLSTVSSAQESWVCTSSFGCGPSGQGYGYGLCPYECQIISNKCVCPGVFSTTQNSNRDLFSYPIPQFDFAGITINLAQIKDLTKNQGKGLYFGPSGAFGYHILINQENLKVWKVESVNWISEKICTIVKEKIVCTDDPCIPECPECVSEKCLVKDPLIANEILIFDGQIPQDCGAIFFEDHLWIGKENETSTIKGKVTVVSADLINSNKKTSVWLQGSIDYTRYDGSDGFLVIAQNNNLIGLYSPNYLTLRGIFVAQNGFFGRNYYPCSKYPTYCQRESLKIFGSIISDGRVGTKWVGTGGQFQSGYKNRETYVDPNLLYAPPIFTPSTSPEFKIVKWEEL